MCDFIVTYGEEHEQLRNKNLSFITKMRETVVKLLGGPIVSSGF